MKIIAAYTLLTGTIIGLLPQIAVASDFESAVIRANFKMGNGRPDPEFLTLNSLHDKLGIASSALKPHEHHFHIVMRVPQQYAIQPGPQSLMASEPSASSIPQPTDSEEQAMLEAWILQMQETQAAVTPSLDLPALVAQAKGATSYDRVQIHDSMGRHQDIYPSNIATNARLWLSKQKGFNWNLESPVSVVAVLNKPKYGKLVRDGQNNFGYEPQRLGTEYLRFIVQNTEGRKMIVTWRIDVRADLEVGQVSPEQGAQYAEYRIPLVDKNNLNAWFQSAQLSALLASAIQTLTGFTDLSSTALGQTTGEGASASITLDTNAASHGWYIDTTPLNSSDDYLPTRDASVWQAKAGSAAEGKMDMLSVLLHEYGHALGLEHSGNGTDVMAASLQPGVRKLPSSEELALMGQLVAQLKVEQGAALTPALSQRERGQDLLNPFGHA